MARLPTSPHPIPTAFWFRHPTLSSAPRWPAPDRFPPLRPRGKPMPAQIRPTRINVSDRFPMVAFKIFADGSTSQAEVAIGADPGLFSPEGKKNRTAANFYSTRGDSSVRLAAGEAGYTVPPEVLARFIGNDKLYFGLATAGEGGAMKVA